MSVCFTCFTRSLPALPCCHPPRCAPSRWVARLQRRLLCQSWQLGQYQVRVTAPVGHSTCPDICVVIVHGHSTADAPLLCADAKGLPQAPGRTPSWMHVFVGTKVSRLLCREALPSFRVPAACKQMASSWRQRRRCLSCTEQQTWRSGTGPSSAKVRLKSGGVPAASRLTFASGRCKLMCVCSSVADQQAQGREPAEHVCRVA